MRQRKIKNIDEKIESYSHISVENPKENKGRWKEIFGNDKPLFLEIGCGKGKFINDFAASQPENNFIAVEGNLSVVIRALEKADDSQLNNVKFVLQYIDDIDEFFQENELDGIYLNFSDPWPKDRHAKRRLTHGDKLLKYCGVVKPEGFIQFKTDNELLFEFTLEQIQEKNLGIIEMSRDLHHSEFSDKNITTEYEEKFSATGKNINYVRIKTF